MPILGRWLDSAAYSTYRRDTDLGFVPLLYLRGEYRFAERWGLAFGYRTVEGGADVDDVYNFAWFNYAVVSGSYR